MHSQSSCKLNAQDQAQMHVLHPAIDARPAKTAYKQVCIIVTTSCVPTAVLLLLQLTPLTIIQGQQLIGNSNLLLTNSVHGGNEWTKASITISL